MKGAGCSLLCERLGVRHWMQQYNLRWVECIPCTVALLHGLLLDAPQHYAVSGLCPHR